MQKLMIVEDDPSCSPALLLLGNIYAGQSLTTRARSMYRKVLDLEPHHKAAAAELAKLETAPEKRAADALSRWLKRR